MVYFLEKAISAMVEKCMDTTCMVSVVHYCTQRVGIFVMGTKYTVDAFMVSVGMMYSPGTHISVIKEKFIPIIYMAFVDHICMLKRAAFAMVDKFIATDFMVYVVVDCLLRRTIFAFMVKYIATSYMAFAAPPFIKGKAISVMVENYTAIIIMGSVGMDYSQGK